MDPLRPFPPPPPIVKAAPLQAPGVSASSSSSSYPPFSAQQQLQQHTNAPIKSNMGVDSFLAQNILGHGSGGILAAPALVNPQPPALLEACTPLISQGQGQGHGQGPMLLKANLLHTAEFTSSTLAPASQMMSIPHMMSHPMGGPQMGGPGPMLGESQDSTMGAEGLRAVQGQLPPAVVPAAPLKKVREATHSRMLYALLMMFLYSGKAIIILILRRKLLSLTDTVLYPCTVF